MTMRQCVPALGSPAPQFSAMSTMGQINLSDYKGKWLVFFSHPGDFTPICTTEFIAFTRYYPEFEKAGCALLGLSIDSNPSHIAWIINIERTTGVKVPFPVLDDRSGDIARLYGMLPSREAAATVRCVFIIDPAQVIRAVLNYPYTNGRCIAEILRLVRAMQATDELGYYTPAGWEPGQAFVCPPPGTVQEAYDKMSDKSYNCSEWYLCACPPGSAMPWKDSKEIK